jgi:tripartite-type tricarboxylate transporter receptor subunit TctC
MIRRTMNSIDFPSGPVRYVVPFRPGGPPDSIARLVAAELAALWGQPVTVDNRPGANGNVGSEFVAHAPADGHTLLQGTSATHGSNAVLFPLLQLRPHTDFVPVVPLIEGPLYLGVNSRQPFRQLGELLDQARARPGELRFATAGPGSPQHLAGELLKVKAGIDILPVHYAGAAQAMQAILNCEVEMYFGSDFMAQPQTAALPLLGVSTRWRWPFAPHVPTLVERGIADFEMHGWFGIFAPSGTPPQTVERINAGVNEVLSNPHVAQGIGSYGYMVLGGSSADFAARMRREVSYWAEIVRTNKLSLV